MLVKKSWPIRVITWLLIAILLSSSVPLTSFATESENTISNVDNNIESEEETQEIETITTDPQSNPDPNLDTSHDNAENVPARTQTNETPSVDSIGDNQEVNAPTNLLEQTPETTGVNGVILNENTTISVFLSQDTQQAGLVDLKIENLPTEGYYCLGETVLFSLDMDDQVMIHEISASLNGEELEVIDNQDNTYSITLPSADDYTGDPDGRLEITVDANLLTSDAATKISWTVSPADTAIITLSPDQENYHPNDVVTVFIDFEDNYELSGIQAAFGDLSLEIIETEADGHDAAYVLQIPDFDESEKSNIQIDVTTQPIFGGYALAFSSDYASVSYDSTSAVPGQTVTATITAESGYILPEDNLSIIAQKEDQNLQEIIFNVIDISDDMQTMTIDFVVPDLGNDEEISILTNIEAAKQLFIRRITLESDNASEDVTGQLTISPTVIYQGVTVTISGIPDTYNQVIAYPYEMESPAISLTDVENGYSFAMPAYDVEIICEEADTPLVMDPEDVYTPNTDFTFSDTSDIPNEPSMEVQKNASWTNIQAGEALLTIAEKDLNQYTNLPCDYIILVDCSATMETVDPGTTKSRYALANDAISQLLDRIQADNASLSDDLKSRVAFMTYSGSGDNGRYPTSAQYESNYYAATDALSTGDYDYFLSGVYEYSGFTTDTSAIKRLLNSNIRRGSKINLALDKTIELLQSKGNSKRMTKVINISDCGNGWYGPMREGYFSGKIITDWLGIHNDGGVTANDKVEAIKNTYGAYFMQICIGPAEDQRDIERTSISEATGDHLFWTYDGTESRFNEIFTQIYNIPYQISATGKQVIDLIDTTYWDIIEVSSCSTGMDTVTLNGNRLTWNIPDGTAEQIQTCTIKLKLKDQYRYLATSDTFYRTNADGATPGCTYRYSITGGIYDGQTRNGSTKTPTLKYGTVEFSGSKTWTVTGSQASSIYTTLMQTLPGYEETAIETKQMSDPDWTYAYTNKDRQLAGKYPYIKYNNLGQTVTYRVTETVPSWYTGLPEIKTGTSSVNTDFYNEPYKIKAQIQKVDEDTGNPLSGAIFEVYQWSLSAGKYIPYKGITFGTVPNTEYEAGNINGSTDIMKLSETSGGIYITPSWLYYTSDNGGQFAIVEAKAPSGYYGDWENDALVTDSSTDEDKIFHEISIDPTGANTGKTLSISNQEDGNFGNQRVLGQISFSKKDLESEKTEAQGDASLEGAIYKLYAKENIVHADGSTGILYHAGDEIPLHLAGSGNDTNVYTYSPEEDNSVITIPEGGNVVIRGLELGKYYLQEISASEGYLVDPDKHEISLDYVGENTSIVRCEATGIFEQIKKQKLSFYKVTDDGSSEVIPLSGAKFSVYLVSAIADGQFEDYTDQELEQAIIDLYRDPETLLYDNMTQFSPAIVYDELESEDVKSGKLVKSVQYNTGEDYRINEENGYLVAEIESDENGIVTLPSLPYGRYLVVETTTPKDKIATRPFVFSVLADDVHGSINSDQDTGGTKLDDLVFLVDQSITSLIRLQKTDASSGNIVLKPGAAYIIHDIDNTWFDYFMDGKTTAEKEAYKAQYGDLIVQYSQGSYIGTLDNPFITKTVTDASDINKSVYIDTIDALPAGTYELEEVTAPSGYVLQGHEGVIKKNRTLAPNYTFYETEENGAWTSIPQGRTKFTVSSEYAVYDQSIGAFVTEVRQANEPAVGKISIYAEGEHLVSASQDGSTIVDRLADKLSGFFNSIKGFLGLDVATDDGLTDVELSSYENYTFTYEVGPVEGAEFILYAAEDIYSQEYDTDSLARLEAAGTPVDPLFHAGEEILTLTTNENGQAWTGSEDWPGTDEAKGLPLGKYFLVQTVAGNGFVLTEENQQPREINIEYAGQTVPIIYRDASYELPRQKVSIQAVKLDQDTGDELSGGIFGLYAAEDIKTESGKTVVKSGTLVAIAETTVNNDGSISPAVFDTDLPLSKYYIKEIRAPYGYTTNQIIDNGQVLPVQFEVDATYKLETQDQDTVSAEWKCRNTISQVQINLMDYYTEVELDGAQLSIKDTDGNAFSTILTKHNDNIIIKGLQPGETYTLTELVSRNGYHYNLIIKDNYIPDTGTECDKILIGGQESDSIQFVVSDTPDLQIVSVFNKPILGDLTIQKTGPVATNPQTTQVTIKEIQADGTIGTVIKNKSEWAYEQMGLPGAEYALRAATDIEYPDGYTGVIFQAGDIILDAYDDIENEGVRQALQISIKDGGIQKDVSAYIGSVPSDLNNLENFYAEYGDQTERQFPSEGEIASDQKLYTGKAVSYTLQTGNEGIVTIAGLPLGIYDLAEVQAPEGYYRSIKDSVKQVNLALNETSDRAVEASADIVFSNDRQRPETDPETGLTNVFITKYGIDGDNRSLVSGAEFTLYAAEDVKNIFGETIIPAGHVAAQAVSGVDGTAHFTSDLPVGRYSAVETSAPAGYYMSSKTISFDLTKWLYADEIHYLDANGYVENPTTAVHITLIDDLTENTLEGASFQILDEDGEIIDAWITDQDGDYTIKGLEFGKTYKIVETLPRNGYLKDITEVQFESDNGQLLDQLDSSITFVLQETAVHPDDAGALDPDSIPGITEIRIANPFVVGNIQISKNGEILSAWTLADKALALIKSIFTYDKEPLANVEFTVYAAEDIIHPDGKTGIVFEAGDIVATGVRKIQTEAVKTTDLTGVVIFEDMYLGNYVIRETCVPNGYVPGKEYPVNLVYQGNVSPVYASEGNINWTNQRQPVSIEITAHDLDNSDILLSDAVFGLYNSEDIFSSSGQLLVPIDTLLETSCTDENGSAVFVTDLPLGHYYVKEIQTPLGYVSNWGRLDIDASYDPQVEALTIKKDFYNEITKIHFRKTALDTKEQLAGCTLAVMDGSNIIQSWQTEDTSHLITGLQTGKEYTLREISPADGYTIAEDIPFVVQDSDPETGLYQDQWIDMEDGITSVTIQKLDTVTGDPLAGSTIGIFSDKDLITKGITGMDGTITFTKIPVGTYYYKELAAPEMYAIDPEEHPFTIHPDGQISGEMTFSDDYVRVQIHKVNTKGEPLANAEFTLYNSTGQAVETKISDESGNLEFMRLPVDSYVIRETKAPSGYRLSQEELKVEVTPTWVNGNAITVENTKKSSSHSHSSVTEENGSAPVSAASIVMPVSVALTGDSAQIIIFVVLLILAVVAIVFIWTRRNKR